ncbi:MAG: DUF2141 domain-containing protein [Cryomorphaceae bacterium]|nr:DUF2141 domain-containing protein [Cryomorphaceae bacterium]
MVFSVFLFLQILFSTSENSIEVEIHNVRNDKGQMLISLYNTSEGFPYEPKDYFTFPKENIDNGVMRVKIPINRPGNYALSVVDDENENLEMDKNFVGVPKEGFGFSNNALPKGLRPPAFDDAKFTVGEAPKTVVSVALKYY